MTYIQKIGEYKDELINLVESFMFENELEKVIFKNPFEIVHSENAYDYSYLIQSVIQTLSNDGRIVSREIETGDGVDLEITDLGIVEIAHLLDELEAGNYDKCSIKDQNPEPSNYGGLG